MENDIRLSYALLVAAQKDAWRRPGSIFLAIQGLQQLASEHEPDSPFQKQIEHELKRLYVAAREPSLLDRRKA